MKATTVLALLGSTIIPAANALVGINWKVPNAPSSGLTNLTFPLTVVQSPSGYFFAQQFNFVAASDVGYTGLQTQPTSGTGPTLRAVFSSFISGTTTTDSNCHQGADGGPGVSCSVDFDGVYGRTYDLEVVTSSSTTWVGTAIDTVTGNRIHIGSYNLPAGVRGIQNNQVGFVQYNLWNDGTHSCSALPYQRAVFGVPRTTTDVGSLSDAYEYGYCVGQVAFKNVRTAGGVQVDCGF